MISRVVFVCGNGHILFRDFADTYGRVLLECTINGDTILVGDYVGVDTLTMEWLKLYPNVQLYHMYDKPRYIPSRYMTRVSLWQVRGGYETDALRDMAMIDKCTHYLAYDICIDKNRKSGTLKNIELCKKLGKVKLDYEVSKMAGY